MLSSKDPAPPKMFADKASANWRPGVSRVTSASRRHFAPLTVEEKTTYRKWRRATLVFYGTFGFIIAAVLIAIGPTDPTTEANSRSAIASAAHPSEP